jgi:two-component system, OmpR family, sensor histidine kinase BaeS
MRIRIVHQLALSLAAAVGLSVLAVGGVFAWNLTGGFADYLRQHEAERLDRFALYLAEQAAASGSLQAAISEPQRMHAVVNGFMLREGIDLPARPAPGTPLGTPPTNRPHDRREGPHDNEPPGQQGDDFPLQLQIVDAHGQRIAGFHAAGSPNRPFIQQPIVVNSQVVGTARLLPSLRPAGIDADFLQRQYAGVLLAALSVLAIKILLGIWMARRWSQPLHRLRSVTRELALGRFDVVAIPPHAALEIGQLFDDVAAMAVSLKKLETSRRRWIAQISHELRSPLSVLRGEIESVEDGAREPGPALIANLAAEVAQISRIVDDLHLLAVADIGVLPCDRVEVDAWRLLRDIVARQLRQPSLAGLAVSVNEPPTAAINALWDPGRVEQVIANLVQNSARYTTRPGHLRISWGRQAQGSDVFFEVQDSAPGVEPSNLAEIFEPLFRSDRSRRRDRTSAGRGGTGLGLAIARAIVTTLGGSIDAQASPLGGLAVRFVLPIGAPK